MLGEDLREPGSNFLTFTRFEGAILGPEHTKTWPWLNKYWTKCWFQPTGPKSVLRTCSYCPESVLLDIMYVIPILNPNGDGY